MNTSNNGTYACVFYDKDAQSFLDKWLHDNKIPNRLHKDELHTTLVYSRVPLNISSRKMKHGEFYAIPDSLVVWQVDNKNV